MCGIGCLIEQVEAFDPELLNTHKDNEIDFSQETNDVNDARDKSHMAIEERIAAAISPRGPNGTNTHIISHEPYISISASLLALRGSQPVFQPVVDELNALVWNGQLYDCGSDNDTLFLFKQLSGTKSSEDLYRVFSQLKGPFSFIYYSAMQEKIYFGRDLLGRRSLLYSYNAETKTFVLSSNACDLTPVFPFNNWCSISTNGIYCLDLVTRTLSAKAWSEICTENEAPYLFAPRKQIVPTSSVEEDSDVTKLVDQFTVKLRDAVRRRVTHIYNRDHVDAVSVGVLFSGGIDSVILTALAYEALIGTAPSTTSTYFIDLLNVSFGSSINQIQSSADRKQSIAAYKELQQLYPDAPFRLILVNVLEAEIEPHKSTIEKLIFPQTTVIDFNIGCALWFASRGVGVIYNDGDESQVSIETNARVLLCGIGSDEQLGGYKRHLNAFTRTKGTNEEKWNALNDELDMDISRLWVRNLGRDDRLIASHGREARNPFLDEDFIMFVRELPLWHIANFDKKDKATDVVPGDKKILRLAAYKMGLIQTSTFEKRAMQFGSNVAKVSYRKQHATTNIAINMR